MLAKSLDPRATRPRFGRRTLALACLAVVALVATAQTFAGDGGDWTTYGHDPANTRNQPDERDITPANASQLALKWVATTSGDVSATPAVSDGGVFFGDFGGTVWKLDANTGAVIWSHAVSDYTGLAGDYARTSPSLDGNVVIVGTNKTPLLLGVNATTGALIWKTQVNPDLHGTMTGSPQLVGDSVLTGVSASGASGPSATFRTDIVSVNALTGAINWESYAVPDNGGNPGGYAGATMFSAPAIDVADNLVFGTFGQPYTEPPSVAACNLASPNGFFSESCEQPGSYFDSIVAFDLTTGAPRWSYRIIGDAPWHRVCDAQPVAWCLPAADTPIAPASAPGRGFGDDWDIGGGSPNVFVLGGREVVGFGAKSGVYYLFDAKTGKLLWNTLVGPGGDQGGFEWGSAYDGSRIYVSLTDQHHIPYQLTENGILTSHTTTGGSWAALDPATGEILWQAADPQTENLGPPTGTVGVWDLGPATVANGVDYVTSMAKVGSDMYALDASDGNVLWSTSAGSSVNAGPAIVNGSVYWGSGYSKSAEGSGNDKLFAFSIGGIVDTTPPSTTIALNPSAPNGSNGWYRSPVGVTVSAIDNAGGVGVYQTRCAVDPATPPLGFTDLPTGACSLSSIAADGMHTVYAASEDRDNNVESPLLSATLKLDATVPTITAAPTTPPNANGWYSGDVVVHFTCLDAGSGIPGGACPPDQTLTGIGVAISSTPETVTDAAGNHSAPSNVVIVKIVDAAGLCDLTQRDVESSSKDADAHGRGSGDALVGVACSALGDGAKPKAKGIDQYLQKVGVLAKHGWLTDTQADTLRSLAGGL